MNWPLQSHGSEILRRAIIDLDNKNFEISMPVHDAVLIHCEKKNLRAMIDDIKQIKQIMSEAAFKVIGWNIAVDAKLIGPQYKQDREHQERWNKLYEKLLNAKGVRITDGTCFKNGHTVTKTNQPSIQVNI